MTTMPRDTYALTGRQLDLAIQCIGRAEVEGAFNGCVVPAIGQRTWEMLVRIRGREPTPLDSRTIGFIRKQLADYLLAEARTSPGDLMALVDRYVGMLSDEEVCEHYAAATREPTHVR